MPPQPPITASQFSPDIETKLAKIQPPITQDYYRLKLAAYRRGDTAKWENDELRDVGLISPTGKAGATKPNLDICDTHEALAKRMRLHYQNPDGSNKLKINITKKVIGEWAHEKRLGAKQIPPPGPLEGARRKWSLQAWIDWFDATLWQRHKKDPTQSNGAVMTEEDIHELEQRTHRNNLLYEIWDKERKKGGYIAVPLAERLFAGMIREYHEAWKAWNETAMLEKFEARAVAQAQTMGLPAEPSATLIAVLKEFLLTENRQRTDAVETAAEKRAAIFAEKLKAEIKGEQI